MIPTSLLLRWMQLLTKPKKDMKCVGKICHSSGNSNSLVILPEFQIPNVVLGSNRKERQPSEIRGLLLIMSYTCVSVDLLLVVGWT